MGRSKKIPSTSPPANAELAAIAAEEAERMRNMNTLQWLGLQTELAVERGLDMCAPGRASRAPRSARGRAAGFGPARAPLQQRRGRRPTGCCCAAPVAHEQALLRGAVAARKRRGRAVGVAFADAHARPPLRLQHDGPRD